MENGKTQDGQTNCKDQSEHTTTSGPGIANTGEQQKDTQVDDEARRYMTPTSQKFWTLPVILQLVFDFVIMAATGTYAVFAIKQWKTMDGQLQEMRGSSRQTNQLICLYQKQLTELQKQVTDTDKLARAAEKQAIASHAIAVLTEQQVTLQSEVASAALHAGRMAISGITFRHLKATKQVTAIIWVQNIGETPAESVSIAVKVGFLEPPKHRTFKHFDGLGDASPHRSFYPQSNVIQIPAKVTSQVYLWGEIQYEAFGVRARPIRFCRSTLAKNILEAAKTEQGDYDYGGPTGECGQ